MSTDTTRAAKWIAPTVVIAIILILVFVATQVFSNRCTSTHESNVKQNLHAIQLALERYATDHDGIYPSYLIGGEGRTMEYERQPDGSLLKWYEEGESARASDVLMRERYLPKYPRNPFARSGDRAESVLAMQRKLPTSITGDDPLRPGTAEGAIYGTRFGANGHLMGQVLCDPRFEKWRYEDALSGAIEEHDTWAIIEYRFWDMWLDPKSREPYLAFSPGQFFYKSWGSQLPYASATEVEQIGEVAFPDELMRPVLHPVLQRVMPPNERLSLGGELLHPYRPLEVDTYVLGAYGGLRSKGMDVLGEEDTSTYGWQADPESLRAELRVPHWTRSQYSNTAKLGSPYAGDLGFYDSIMYTCPNGIMDSIILVLTDLD